MNYRFVKTHKVKPISAYLKKSVKFYDIDNPLVAQVIFVILLAVVFGGYLFMMPYASNLSVIYEQMGNRLIEQMEKFNYFDFGTVLNTDLYTEMINALMTVSLILLLIKALSFLVSLFYGCWYYLSLSDPGMPYNKRILLFFRRLPKIIIFNIVFYAGLYIVGMAFFTVAAIISVFVPLFALMAVLVPVAGILILKLFVFKDLLIIEFNPGIFRNMKKSLDLTRGSRKNVIINGLWPFFAGWILSLLATGFGNQMMSLLILSFMEVIMSLVSQRLNVLMFLDALAPEN